MAEYIEREDALDIIKRTQGDFATAWIEVAHLPASDVAPVRHGTWIMHDDDLLGRSCECSECHIETCGDTPRAPSVAPLWTRREG